ncbi:hypothetical protein [Actinoplanes sp. NPDC051494]|uniref:hypothetical protein n=1 Tax=Actinoplanes sp. NPDC051494 TaxID=3363907 RepID=UPI00378BD02D
MWPGDRMMPPLVRGRAHPGPGPLRLRVMTGLALAAAAALLVTVVLSTDRGPLAEHPAGDVVRVGVVDGQSVSGYLRSTRGELTAMIPSGGTPTAGDTWALVSLAAYVAPDDLRGLLGDVPVAQVYARAPMAGPRTPVVRIPVYRMPEDVVTGLLDAAVARDVEQADYRKLGGELHGDGDNEQRLRRAYDTAARTAAAESAAFRARCACVFAAVVRAGPSALDLIAARSDVRAVDPAPEVRSLDRTEFRPVRPEETTTVPDEESPSGPIVSAPSAVAPETSAPLPSSSGAGVTSASSDRRSTSAPAPEESTAAPSVPPTDPVPEQRTTDPGASQGAPGR